MNDTKVETMLSLALCYIYGCESESSYSNHNVQDHEVHRKIVFSFIEVSRPV